MSQSLRTLHPPTSFKYIHMCVFLVILFLINTQVEEMFCTQVTCFKTFSNPLFTIGHAALFFYLWWNAHFLSLQIIQTTTTVYNNNYFILLNTHYYTAKNINRLK